MIVIGLLGRAGSGKSSAAKYLAEKIHAQRHSFARPVKDLAKRVFQFSDEQVYGTQAQKETIDPRYGISPREALIRIGDGARHAIGPSVWIDCCFNAMRSSLAEGRVCVIEDTRYPNEAGAIVASTDFNGFVVKLDYADRASGADPNAPSECSVDEVNPSHIFSIVHHWNDNYVSLKSGLDDVVMKIWEAVK